MSDEMGFFYDAAKHEGAPYVIPFYSTQMSAEQRAQLERFRDALACGTCTSICRVANHADV